MSGPKCASYDVEENLQLEGLARAQAWEAASTIERHVGLVERRAQHVAKQARTP
jgi:hypothetical protein